MGEWFDAEGDDFGFRLCDVQVVISPPQASRLWAFGLQPDNCD